jgi:hypothetical protein
MTALRREEADERQQRGRFWLASFSSVPRPPRADTWKQRAINELVDLLLDPDDTRPRDRIARGGNITVRITQRRNPPRADSGDEAETVPEEHLMTLDHELRWIEAVPKGLSPFRAVEFKEPSRRQIRTQTTDLDRTGQWDWAELRQSRIRKSLGRDKRGLARCKSVEEAAIDRTDMRRALKDCSAGELRALILSARGHRLNSTDRVLLMRARNKASDLRKQNLLPVPVVNEGNSGPEPLPVWRDGHSLLASQIPENISSPRR